LKQLVVHSAIEPIGELIQIAVTVIPRFLVAHQRVVHELRKKLEDHPASPQYILTEPYIGYRFKEPENCGQAS
jgi:DNA-binding transcriptional regulator PaaX